MSQRNVIVRVNANFHHIAGENLFKKRDNRFKEYREKWERWPKQFYVGEFPLFIDIEVTSICNLKCPFCATTFRDKKIKKGFMSPGIVKNIIDEGAANNLYGVKFNIRGEPLLHPQIHDFVRYAKKKGLIDVYFNTNAVLLTKEVAKRLIDAGLDRISISVDGYTKEVYEKYRVGANFKTVISNIENMQSLKRRQGVTHPKIRIQAVRFPEIEPAFDNYKKFWSSRADEIAFIDYKEMNERKKGIKYAWACPQIWQRMGIFYDGTILPCNHDDDALLALGNIKRVSIKEAWFSKKMNSLRQLHKKGMAYKVAACDGCYLRDSEISKLLKGNKSRCLK